MLRRVWTSICAVRETMHKQTRTNRKLGWIAIRVHEDFEGGVPRTALDKIP
jgi:hypothetical protein